VGRHKDTTSVEIAPVSKDDVICLTQKQSRSLGGFGPLVIVARISSSVHMVDPLTARTHVLNAQQYWADPMPPLMSSRALVEYVVLDIEFIEGSKNGRYQMADAEVARRSDFGSNDKTFHTRTHLGNLLQAGDTALGFDLFSANLADTNLNALNPSSTPEVILVRKTFTDRTRKRRVQNRRWKLEHLRPAVDEEGLKKMHRVERGAAVRREADLERFMEELEEDAEMRAQVDMYRIEGEAIQQMPGKGLADAGEDEEEVEEYPEVPDDELLAAIAALRKVKVSGDELGEGPTTGVKRGSGIVFDN